MRDKTDAATSRIHTVMEDSIAEHHVEGLVQVPRLVEFIRERHDQWGDGPLLFELSNAALGETNFEDWLDARDQLWPIAERRVDGRTALVSRHMVHDGILRAFKAATERQDCAETIGVFDSRVQARTWLLDGAGTPADP